MKNILWWTADAPHDYTRKRWSYFAYEDAEVLSKEGWNRIIMPYSAFKLYRKGEGTTSNELLMNRNEGFRIEIENTTNEACGGEFQIDNLEQLTSYELKAGKPKFSSIFIQLNKEAYENEDWDQQFQDSRAVGIDMSCHVPDMSLTCSVFLSGSAPRRKISLLKPRRSASRSFKSSRRSAAD